MNNKDKASTGDYGYAITKGVIGMVPIAGALASELLGLLVASPLEKRRQKWMEEVGTRLRELEEKNELDLASLSENELFVDVVSQSTAMAIKTSEMEKIAAFQNAIINTARGEMIDVTRSRIFLNLIDSFTTWHIRILVLFAGPEQWFSKNNVSFTDNMSSSLFSVIVTAYPELRNEDELLDLIWMDLKNAGMHNTGSLKTMMTVHGAIQPRISAEGGKFIEFISNAG